MDNKELYLVELDLGKLESDLRFNNIKDEEWFSIVEAFIESFEKEKEVAQLLSISRMHISNPRQKMLKAVFNMEENGALKQITDRVYVDKSEYYDKLLTCNPISVESKIRLVFHYKNTQVSIEWLENTPFVALQLKKSDISGDLDGKEILENFSSVKITEELHVTIEEAFYQRRIKTSAV